MSDYLFPDNTVVCNFSIINQLILLRTFLGNNARVTEAVDREIMQSARVVPHLHTLDRREWFGDPVVIDDPKEADRVEVTRIASFGGKGHEPLRHLGESQTLFVISNWPQYRGARWITDDGPAFKLAVKRNIRAQCTVDIFKALVGSWEITAAQAFQFCRQIEAAGRYLLHSPNSVRDFQ